MINLDDSNNNEDNFKRILSYIQWEKIPETYDLKFNEYGNIEKKLIIYINEIKENKDYYKHFRNYQCIY